MRRSTSLPLLTLLAAGALAGCTNGTAPDAVLQQRLAAQAQCAPPPEVSAVPVGVAGDWWNAGAMPPTLRLEQEGTALRAELAFSGVIRQGGTGRIQGACVSLSFPARAGSGEQVLTVEGRLLSGNQMRIQLAGGDPATDPRVFVLDRQPATR